MIKFLNDRDNVLIEGEGGILIKNTKAEFPTFSPFCFDWQ